MVKRRLGIFDILYMLIGIPTVFMMLVTSRGFTMIKTILLALTTVVALLESLVKKIKYPSKYLFFLIIFIGYYFLSLAIGIFNGFEFSSTTDFSLIQYYIITPVIVFLCFGIFSSSKGRLSSLKNILDIITIFIVVMDVWKLLAYRGILPDIDRLNLIMVASDNMLSNHLAMRVSNEYVLMFLLPFYIVLFSSSENSKNKRVIYAIILVFGIVYSLLSGRKILELVVFATAIIMLIYQLAVRKKYKALGWTIIAGVLILFFGNYISEVLGFDNLILTAQRTLQRGLSLSDSGMIIRINDARALLNMWAQSPIWGWGLNSYAVEAIANTVTKWSYEIVYVALLAQTGLVGVTLFFLPVVHICKNAYLKYRKTGKYIFLATFVGFISFIICGATNPLVYVSWPWVFSLSVCKSNEEQI